jgi:sulfotransferase family protein
VIANAVIAGAEKSGTTSLFRSLSEHPDVSASTVKETRYFQPLMYGHELEPLSVYEQYFAGAGHQAIRLEATPRYLYGGRVVAQRMHEVLGPEARIVMALREPVARFESFFTFQKARLRIEPDIDVAAYLARADALTPEERNDPANHVWLAYPGGCYADFLPAWHDVFGEHLYVLFFDELVKDTASQLRAVALFLGIDPEAFPSYAFASENRTTAYKRAGFQKIALGLNDRFERFFRRHYKLKDRLRAAYYRVNGRGARERVADPVKAMLRARYEEPNRRLAEQLVAMGVALPPWLDPQYSNAE